MSSGGSSVGAGSRGLGSRQSPRSPHRGIGNGRGGGHPLLLGGWCAAAGRKPREGDVVDTGGPERSRGSRWRLARHRKRDAIGTYNGLRTPSRYLVISQTSGGPASHRYLPDRVRKRRTWSTECDRSVKQGRVMNGEWENQEVIFRTSERNPHGCTRIPNGSPQNGESGRMCQATQVLEKAPDKISP